MEAYIDNVEGSFFHPLMTFQPENCRYWFNNVGEIGLVRGIQLPLLLYVSYQLLSDCTTSYP